LNWNFNELEKLKTFDGTQDLFPNKTYSGILNTLSKKGYNNFIINDYWRDNLMIGSESSNNFTGTLNYNNYERFTNDFKSSMEESVNQKFGENIRLETSGVKSLESIIDPNRKWEAAILYNGDALDAYYSSDNFDELIDGKDIKVVIPDNPIFLLDGLVINNNADKNELNKLYDVISKNIYDGIAISDDNEYNNLINNSNLLNQYKNNPLFINFDYVNYSTPFKYFRKLLFDTNGLNYFSSNYALKISDLASGIDSDKIIFPIDDKLQSISYSYYMEKLYS